MDTGLPISVQYSSTMSSNLTPILTPNDLEVALFDDLALPLPPEFVEMSISSKYCVAAYSTLFILSSALNSYTLCSIYQRLRSLRTKSHNPTTRTSLLLILNLCVADLIVTLFLMPMEVIWRITIGWYGGDVLCKFCQFFRAFGLYLSSLVLICISVDRFYAIVYPLKMVGAKNRVKIMLWGAWVIAATSALPQILYFQVTSHPKYPSFRQCVTRTFLFRSDHDEEFMYNLFSVSALYILPLFVIVFTYSMIFYKIHRKSQPKRGEAEFCAKEGPSSPKLPQRKQSEPIKRINRLLSIKSIKRKPSLPPQLCSCTYTNTNTEKAIRETSPKDKEIFAHKESVIFGSSLRRARLGRAKTRTRKLMLKIILSFIICWTPYVTMTLWYMINRKGAQKVDPCVQEVLFIMAVANSVIDPMIYGIHKQSFGRGTIFRKIQNR